MKLASKNVTFLWRSFLIGGAPKHPPWRGPGAQIRTPIDAAELFLPSIKPNSIQDGYNIRQCSQTNCWFFQLSFGILLIFELSVYNNITSL